MCARVCVSFLSYQRLDARQLRPADSPGRHAAVGRSTAAPRTTCACWCSPTSWCSARLACVFAAPGLARNGIRLGRPPLQRSSGLVVLELLPMDSLGRVLALPAALRQGALRGQPPGGDAWRCGADGRAAADDSLLHRRPSGYPLSRLARLEMGARRSPCSTVHRLRRRVCAPQDTEMLPASNFVCEFGECVRPTSPLLGACGNCLLAVKSSQVKLYFPSVRGARKRDY